MAEWPCCHDPLRFSPLSLRFVPPLHRDPSCTIILPRRFCSTHLWRAGIFPKCPETPTPKERIVRHASVRPFEHVGAWGTLGHRRGHVAGAWPTSRTRRCTCRVPAAPSVYPPPLLQRPSPDCLVASFDVGRFFGFKDLSCPVDHRDVSAFILNVFDVGRSPIGPNTVFSIALN